MPKINKKTLSIFFLAMLTGSLIAYCKAPEEPVGPGMIITEQTYDNEMEIIPTFKGFPSGMTITNIRSITRHGGSTGGGSDDSRRLPEWVDYEWRDVPEFKNDKRTIEEQITFWKGQPLKHQRVLVASRVPQSVIQEAIEAVKHRKYGETPDKTIWLYFTWYKGHIYFSWRLNDKKGQIARKEDLAGGDTCKDGMPIQEEYGKDDCF
jgi:hypothetical protein